MGTIFNSTGTTGVEIKQNFLSVLSWFDMCANKAFNGDGGRQFVMLQFV